MENEKMEVQSPKTFYYDLTISDEEKEQEESAPTEETATKRPEIPLAVTKKIAITGALLLGINFLGVLAFIGNVLFAELLIIIIILNIVMASVFINTINTAKNQRIKYFTGVITEIEQKGIKGINYINIVTVVSDDGIERKFNCTDHKKILEGNNITFFFDEDMFEKTDANNVSSDYISVQYSKYIPKK